jgi:hypothetical protein
MGRLRNGTEHFVDMVEDAIEDEVQAIGRFVKRVCNVYVFLGCVLGAAGVFVIG